MGTARFWQTMTAVAVALGVIGLWQAAVAQNGSAPPEPTIVALVNLERLVQDLDERAAREEELQGYFKELQTKLDEMAADIRRKQEELQIYQPGSPEAKEARLALLRLEMRARQEQQISEALLGQRTAEMQVEIFDKIRAAIARLAERRGYQLVLSHDGQVELTARDRDSVQKAIAARRVLWAENQLDITEELLRTMNNEWAAGGGAG